MPADPTQTVPRTQRLPTEPVDIGHVAPDFSDRKFFNSLVIRPELRISLRLGEIENLFPDLPSSFPGRRARMQVLGMYYFPLKHPKSADALNIAWDHYKKVILGGAGDAAADADIQSRLKEWVIHDGTLPPPPDDPAAPKKENFARLRLPGAYTFFKPWGPLRNPFYTPNPPAAAPYPKVGFSDDFYDYETFFFDENPVLGKIPLIATVEKRDPETLEWKPLPEAMVYFQLIPPAALPAFDKTKPVADQLNRPDVRSTNLVAAGGGGPAKLTTAKENTSPSDTDPQTKNAHHTLGGKRGQGSLSDGSDVDNIIFSTQSTPGFNAAHPTRPLPHTPYELAEKVGDAARPHAVKAKTNADGEAGVIFMPSRCGGDRYAFRAFIGPPTKPSDGKDITAISVDTGTLVTWRSLRISRYLRQPVNALDATILNDWKSVPYQFADINHHQFYAGAVSQDASHNFIFLGLNDINIADIGNNTTIFDGLAPQFARAFVELEFDPGANAAVDITQAQWTEAMNEAVVQARAANTALGTNYDIDVLFYRDTPGVTVANTMCHIPMRTARAYNAVLDAASSARQRIRYATNPATEPDASKKFLPHTNDIDNLDTMLWSYCFPALMRRLARFGCLPGITMVDGGFGCTWQLPGRHIAANSGVAIEYRGHYVWKGQRSYPARNGMSAAPIAGKLSYDFTGNVSHETGHCLFRKHAKGSDAGGGEGGGADAVAHDPVADCTCVMSYKTCEGQFCAKCLFTFRGWDVKKF